MQRDWWKWGDPKEIKHINDYPKLKTLVEERWKTHLREDFFPPKKFELPQLSEKKKEQIKDIFASIYPKKISFSDDDRLFVSLGKSYYDVIRKAFGKFLGDKSSLDKLIKAVPRAFISF